MAEYGRPLGYFGYLGTHAAVGTFGPWGMFPALLTGTLARIFGWGLHAFVYYNFFYLALAALLFIIMTKPDIRGLVMLAVANAMAYIAICYAAISMNECVRYAMAIVLTGLMYRLYTVPEVPRWRQILRWTLVPLLIAYAVCFYKILAVFVPVYVIVMLRRWKPVWRVVLALPVTYVAVQGLSALNGRTCAPYLTGEASYTLPTLKLRVSAAFYSFLSDAQNIDPIRIIAQTTTESDPILSWFCILLYAAMGILIWQLIKTAKDPARRTVSAVTLLSLWLLGAFWGGHLLLYNTTMWTFIRGCYTAVYCVMLLSCLMPKGNSQPWWTMMTICLLGVFTFMNTFCNTFTTSSHFSSDYQESQWEEQAEQLAQYLVLDEDTSDPWANTVVLSGADASTYYILPAGTAVNSPTSDTINENARYVIVGYNDNEDTRSDT